MKVFISWSGELSHQVAKALRDFLPVVLPGLTAWMSSTDIPKGSRWGNKLGQELSDTDYGIVCVVPGNWEEPWLNFEAGSLAKSVEHAHVAPVLVGLDPADISGPLSQFQATKFEREDVRMLVRDLAKLMKVPPPAQDIDRNFDICWSGLSSNVHGAVEAIAGQEASMRAGPGARAAPAAAGPSGIEIQILQAIAMRFGGQADEEPLALAFRMPRQKVTYHLEALESAGLLDTFPDTMRGIYVYSVSSAGRKFLVDKGLL
jgi:hypothetical protein